MEYRILGETNLNVSAVGFGCWVMGGHWWGPVNDNDSIAAVHEALDLGINFFDTADVYGLGHAEKILGRALGVRRKEVIVATKVGLRWNNKGAIRNDLSREHILSAVDVSLERLGTDYIDLYQAHWPDPNTPIEETVEALMACVEAGKVRFIGASNLSPEQLKEYRRHGPVATLQPPLNMFERHAEVQLLPLCFKENVGVLSYGSLCRGLLTGKFAPDHVFQDRVRADDPLFQGETFKRNLAMVERLKELAAAENKTPAQLAVAWVLAHSGVSIALSGARRPEQIAESAGGAGWPLTHETLQEIDKILIET